MPQCLQKVVKSGRFFSVAHNSSRGIKDLHLIELKSNVSFLINIELVFDNAAWYNSKIVRGLRKRIVDIDRLTEYN